MFKLDFTGLSLIAKCALLGGLNFCQEYVCLLAACLNGAQVLALAVWLKLSVGWFKGRTL